MKKLFIAATTLVVFAISALTSKAVEPTWEYSVQVSATVQATPPKITLTWPQDTLGTPSSYTVYRKAADATSWGSGVTLSGSTTSYADTSVTAGTAYEYQVVKAASSYSGYGYIYAGVNVPLIENRGKVVLVVDDTYASQLATELTRLERDLVGDGWTVLRHDVSRTATPASVKNLIKADYNADPANTKAVFLFGHVPVPYSGNIVPDGHSPEHNGAWPADAYYGDMDGSWTDSSVNNNSATDARNRNVPGDGKFDQSTIPGAVKLQVGRVDLSNLPGRKTWGGPATFASELDLLRQYLNKDHNFRHKAISAQRRGIVGDYFGTRNGEAFAASGYRAFAPFFGASNIMNLNTAHNDAKGVWTPALKDNDYLWAYGCGAGSYASIGGLGNSGSFNDVYATELVESNIKAVFTMLFGSWLGDWDSSDNIMRSVLATKDYGLTSVWSGRPHWFFHHMALGENIGYSARLTQNNKSGLYRNQQNSSAGGIHIALMGDPTLRMHTVAPVGNLGGTAGGSSVNLTWSASPDSVLGYHVYRAASVSGPFTRLTSSLVTSTSYQDASPIGGNSTYMVRAVKLENSASGSYYNASQGQFWTIGGVTVPNVDTTSPSITLTSPSNGSTISTSTLSVSANATDNVGVVGVQFKLDGANMGTEVLLAPFTKTWSLTDVSAGQHTLTAVARDLAGNVATASSVSFTVASSSGGTSGGGTGGSSGSTGAVVWVDDTLPAGATGAADGGDSWNWTSASPAPYAGSVAHQSAISAGLHQHYFDNATATLPVAAGDKLFAYVYLDPANPPRELMLQWTDGSWDHRAYWGENLITYGTTGTASRYNAGALPATGQWVLLEVPASAVGLEGKTVKGMAFSAYGGRVTWDYAGKTSATGAPSEPTTPTTPSVPAVTAVVADGSATIGSADNATLTFTRSGDTTVSLPVSFNLGGNAVKWTDYRRPEGDMPVSLTIPAGSASANLVIRAVDNVNNVNPHTVTVTLASNAGYTIGTSQSLTVNLLAAGGTPAPEPAPGTNSTSTNIVTAPSSIVNYTALELPKVGDSGLNILSPTMLELHAIGTKAAGAAPTIWNLVTSGTFNAPALSQFVVTVDGQPVAVQAVGFKRRPLYAPLAVRDLRIDNCLYLRLATPIADNQTVEVKNPGAALWPATMLFTAKAEPLRYSPAIHVNQEGYVPALPKKAMVGYYLGSMGEMDVATSLGFSLVNVQNGATVHQGTLRVRADVGYTYSPTPYQKVLEADFSSFTTPGEYQLKVPGLGASLPFLINEGIAMGFTRAYALGLYNQRCGVDHSLPYTRHTHEQCHHAPASVPMPQSSFLFTWNTISNYTLKTNPDYPAQTAPKMTSPSAQLFPFVKTGTVDVSGGHHDAGDYSKYTINSAHLIHYLMFAVDSLPGVGALDNLGLPESGDGISDVLQAAKWESDYLVKLQDTDGGFYFLVYPREREYESGTQPDEGDPQVVWPKTTASTAASVAALAQTASSPLFKQKYPAEAALYMEKARLGWQFLMNAIAAHGKDGSYQKITHYGDDYRHDDELAWAAAQMFVATGEAQYHQKLMEWFPDPSASSTFRWGWWRLYASYGHAIRSYAFAARSGRLNASQLNAAYLAKCEAQVIAGGDDALLWSQQGAYGSSFPEATKRVRGAGWYFSTEHAFDITVAHQLTPKAAYLDAILANVNYEAGANPVNVSYLTGMGWKRQREIVHQYAQSDDRVMPPSGVPVGNVQGGFIYSEKYGTELTELTFPNDDASTAPYPFYDRWADNFNVTTEFVAVTQARSLASVAYLATLTSTKNQAWKSATGTITGVPAEIGTNGTVTASLQVSGLDISGARILWEARGQEPAYGSSYSFTPSIYGDQWVEAEAQWPDGRRVVAVANFFATNSLPTVSVVATDSSASESGDTAVYTFTRTGSTAAALTVNYKFSGTGAKWSDYRRPQGDMPESIVIPAGASSATLTICAFDDTTVEPTETAILTVQADPAYNVGTARTATVYLYDNDGAVLPTVTVTATDANASETLLGVGVFTITRTGLATSPLTINYTLGGTATQGADYNATSLSLTLPIGISSAVVMITPVDDSLVEGSETVVLTLTDNGNYQMGAGTSATITIEDNDTASAPVTVSVSATDATASRVGTDPGVFTVTRTGSTAAALTVNVSYSGTAANGTDYNTLSSSITIPAGSASASVTLTPKASTSLVGAKTATLTLSSGASYDVGTGTASITIIGNAVPVTSVKKETGGMRVSWNSIAGKSYRVLIKNNLMDTTWSDASGSVEASGSAASWVDNGSGAQRYYMVFITN